MNNRIVILAGAGLLAFTTHANAMFVSVVPSTQTVGIGDPVSVEIVASGLGSGQAPSISVYDLNLSFDPVLLSFTGALFGDPLLGDQLDLFGSGSDRLATAGTGTVNLFQLSYDFPWDIDDFQADAFTLVTVSFSALAEGTSALSLSLNSLGDAYGDPLPASLTNGSVNIASPTAIVPIPASLGLLASGLGILFLGAGRIRR